MNRKTWFFDNGRLSPEALINKLAKDEDECHDVDQNKKIERRVHLVLDANVLFGQLSKTDVKHHGLFAWVDRGCHLANNGYS